jgi:HNH endonuclease
MSPGPCIYCRATDVPRNEEHVLQKAFGSSLTLQAEVCEPCNSFFSRSDKDLFEHVEMFVVGRPWKILGLGLHLDEEAGVRLTYRVGLRGPEKGLLIPPPQLFRHPNGSWQFRGPSVGGLDAMRTEVSAPTSKVTERLDPPEPGKPPSALAVVRTAPATFLVRGAVEAEVSDLARRLRSTGLELTRNEGHTTWVPPAKPPPLDIKSQLPVGSVARSLAKVALNFLCSLFGTDVALQPEFDPLRSFARYDEGSFMDFVSLAILDEPQRKAANPFSDPERHALVLVQVPDGSMYRLGVQVVLHGKSVAIVRMSKTATPLLPLGTWRVTYFDHVRKTVEHLAIPHDGIRCFPNIDAVVPGASSLWEEA